MTLLDNLSDLLDVADTIGNILGTFSVDFEERTNKFPKDAQMVPFLGIIQKVDDPERKGRVQIARAKNPDVIISEWMNVPGYTAGLLPGELVGKMCYCLAIEGDVKKTLILGLHGEDNTSLPLKMAELRSTTLPECNQLARGTMVLVEKPESDVVYVCKKTNSAYIWTPIGDTHVTTAVAKNPPEGGEPGYENQQTVFVPENQVYFTKETPNMPAFPVYRGKPNKGSISAQRPVNAAILTSDSSSRTLCTDQTVGTLALLQGKDGLNQTPMMCMRKNGVPTWCRLGSKEQTMIFDTKTPSREYTIDTNMQKVLEETQSGLHDTPLDFDVSKHASSGRITNPLDLTSFILLPPQDFDTKTIEDYTRSLNLNAEQEVVVLRNILSKFIKAFKVCDNNITLIEYYLGIVTTGFHGMASDMLDMSEDIQRNAQAIRETSGAYEIQNPGAVTTLVNKANATEKEEVRLQNIRGTYTDYKGEKKPIPGLIGRVSQAKEVLDLFTEYTGTGVRTPDESKGEIAFDEVLAYSPKDLEQQFNTEISSIEILEDS